MTNQDIRRTAAGAGVKLWQIAEALGVADCSLSRKLRRELPAEEKEKIFSIIRELEKVSVLCTSFPLWLYRPPMPHGYWAYRGPHCTST